MAIVLVALSLSSAALADPHPTAGEALSISVTACEMWVTETIAHRDAAASFPGLGLQPEATGPDIPGLPADIERGASHRYRIGFPGGDAWLIVADGVPACHVGLLSPAFIGPQFEAALATPAFAGRWIRVRDEPLGAVWQRTYNREDSATLFMTMTARTRPGPEGSLAQLIYSMGDRDHPIAIEP